MEIKLTGSPEQLQEIHQLLYEHDKNIEVDEEHGPVQGYQKEPVVTALITAATTITVAVINAYFKRKREQYKTDKSQETALIEIYLKDKREWKKIDDKELKPIANQKKKKNK